MTQKRLKVTDLTNPETNPIPEQAQELVAALLEGRVKSLFVVAEVSAPGDTTEWIEMYETDVDDHITDDRAFVGAVTQMYQSLLSDMNPVQLMIQVGGEEPDDDDEPA